MKKILLLLLLLPVLASQAQKKATPLPTKSQLAWHGMEFYLFTHFGPNTFTDKEWGEGTEPEDIFNPTSLDCEQWCRVAKAAGAKGIIITAKHHDGFCLWPSKFSEHTVKQSAWRAGQGDVLKELAAACKQHGLKFGVYLSPWDRNHPQYGTPAYNDTYIGMMKEIFAAYGPIWEMWWDGANGEGPNGKRQVYDWKRFESTVRKASPATVIFSDIGPDIRWCGNERGTVGETVWNFLNTAGFTPGLGAPPVDTLQTGNYNGRNWVPAECDVSIRPGWFYHKEEDGKVKTPEELFKLYLQSVGRGANLLLNVPPDRHGLIHEADSAALVEFAKLREQSFLNDLVKTSGRGSSVRVNKNYGQAFQRGETVRLKKTTDSIQVSFDKAVEANAVVLRESLEHGQRVRAFKIVIKKENGDTETVDGTSIGAKRIITFPKTRFVSLTLHITKADALPVLYPVQAFLINERLLKN